MDVECVEMRKTILYYFVFTRAERNAGIFLIFLIICVCSVRFWWPGHTLSGAEQKILLEELLARQDTSSHLSSQQFSGYDSVRQQKYYQKNYSTKFIEEEKSFSAPLSPFLADTITVEQWMEWGVPVYVAERIKKYISKGGKLYQQEDLASVYGFPEELVEIIGAQLVNPKTASTNTFEKSSTNVAEIVNYAGPVVDLNSITNEQLLQIGFSENDASRIIRFREQSGGFYAADQLYGIFGVDAGHIQRAIPWLTADAKKVILINLNTADSITLAEHVYISNELAGAIVRYRLQTGKFYAVTEVRKVEGMYPALFEKLKPYLRL